MTNRLLARWDASPAEQADLTFQQVLTLVNLRRVEIACLLGLFTSSLEYWTGSRPALQYVEMPLMAVFLIMSLYLRDRLPDRFARGFVLVAIVGALFTTQWNVAALAAQGRLTSGYPTMLLSLTMLFVAPPRRVVVPLIGLFITYCLIVNAMVTSEPVKLVAVANTAIVSVISLTATALIYSARRRDYEQKREIRLQNLRLLERNVELDSLMAITAHDLRSPLYGLRNLFDLAVRRAAQEPGLPLVVLGQAIASLDAMLALATRMLDAHAAEHQRPGRLIEDDLRGHILAAADRIAPLAQSMGVRIDLDLPETPLIASLEEGALAQILDNLLSNGVRFSPPGTALAIGAVHAADLAEIRVKDRGPGVDPTQRARLFERYSGKIGQPLDGAPTKGIGLFIVATLAQRMGASVKLETTDEGGAVFLVSLHRQRPDSPSSRAPTSITAAEPH